MPAKLILFGKEAREKVLSGLDQLYRAVSVTLGPGGRNVLFRDSHGTPVSTKDGVTVARRVVLKDSFEDAGAQLCKSSANRAATAVGDGTTTATVLTWSFVSKGSESINKGANSTSIRRGMDRALAELTAGLKKKALPIKLTDKDLIRSIATISGNSEEIGSMVAEAYFAANDDALVIIEASQRPETYLDSESGFTFQEGYEDELYINVPSKQLVEYDDPVILVTSKRIQDVQELAPFLARVMKDMVVEGGSSPRPLVIISATMEDQPRAMMVLNKTQRGMPWCSVRAPGFETERRENLEDLAVALGAEFIPEETQLKLENIDTTSLGTCKKIMIGKEKTTILGGNADPDKLAAHIAGLRARLTGEITDEDKKRVEKRIAQLTQGISVIKIFAPTVEDLREQAFRYEDSILAVKAALSEGIVPGGGTALVKLAARMKGIKTTDGDEELGYLLVKQGVLEPMQRILSNAGMAADTMVEQAAQNSNFWVGWNAKSGKLENLLKSRVLDPVKVTRIALEAAVSTAAVYLNTECIIVDDPDDMPPLPSYASM